MSSFGQRLINARKRQKMSQAELADHAGVTRSAVGGYEIEGKEASYSVLVKMARALGVTTDYLLGLDDNAGWHQRNNVATAFYDLELLYDRAPEGQKEAIDALLLEVDKLLALFLKAPDEGKLGHLRDTVVDLRRLMFSENEQQ